jgi:hypothetical protein
MTTPTGSAAGTVKRYTLDVDGTHVSRERRILLEPAVAASDYDALAAERDAWREQAVDRVADWKKCEVERDALKAQLTTAQSSHTNDTERCDTCEHIRFVDHRWPFPTAQSSEERLKQVLRKVQIELRGVGPESSREFHRIGIESALGMLKAALSTHPSAREQGEAHDARK